MACIYQWTKVEIILDIKNNSYIRVPCKGKGLFSNLFL